MNPDPIVDEVRAAGAKLAAEAGNDVHRFFQNLQKAQKKYGKPLIGEPVPSCEAAISTIASSQTRRGGG